MTELQRGTLKVTPRKDKPPLVQVDINGKLFTPPQEQLSSNLTLTNGMEVEFERVGGQPKQVRGMGQAFVAHQAAQPSKRNIRIAQREPSKQQQSGASGGQRSPQGQAEPSGERIRQDQRQCDFHNPYSFVPALPRQTDDLELGDGPPVHYDAFDSKRYSGRIRVRMTVKTPILVPDTDPANVQEDSNGHKTFRLRVDEYGLPSIPASSIRGMLRSAFEAITNSRFGRFSNDHKRKIQYRESQRPFRKVDFPASPWDLLHPTLRPAALIEELSPADRVFGWVRTDADLTATRNQSDRVAVRGCLRVGPVVCESSLAEAVEKFPPSGVPLAILAAPKPQQGRFYVAASPNGDAQRDNLSKVEAGYSPGKGLRGRKVYPHHQGLPNEHWKEAANDKRYGDAAQTTRPREYIRHPDSRDGQGRPNRRDDQNRSILDWVKPGAVFTFDLHVHNLSKVELGALLWLLRLPEEHYHRLGGGKPLGFGSVRLSIDECDVRTGNDLRSRYMAWHPEVWPADPTEAAVQAFKEALVRAYSIDGNLSAFDNIPFISSFLVACKGFPVALPVHYPRATSDGQPAPPSPDGESFKWFVANEKADARYALPDLSSDSGLPTLPDSQQSRGDRGQKSGRSS